MQTLTRPRRALVPALAALGLAGAAAPGLAQAASAPGVSTGNATAITQTSANLTGKVNPKGVASVYFFQYGPSANYGATTTPVAAGDGTAAKNAATAIASLAPDSKYHFRLVAKSGAGTSNGADHTFTTHKQPLGLALTATPNPVPYGAGTSVSGVLSGSDNVGQQVSLLANAYPFTAGFQPAPLNAQVISSTGTFAFPIPALTITTQYKVVVADRPNVVSPILTVSPTVTVTTHVSTTHVKRGRSIRFYGSISPARDGAQVAIQKLNGDGVYVTVSGTTTKHESSAHSTYSKHVKVSRGGSYRVFVGLNDGDVANGTGSTVKIHSHH